MAKPINLFQGPAPQAMAMMGQGLSEAGARIGQFEQQGMQALGQGLAQGLQGAAGAVSSLNTAKAANNVTKSIFGDENMFKTFFPEGTEDQRKTMLNSLNQAISRDGQMGGMQFSSQVMGPFLEQQRLGQQFQKQMQLAGMHEAAATQRSTMALDRHTEEELAKMLFNSPKSQPAVTPITPIESPSRRSSGGFLGKQIRMTLGRE